MPCDIGGCEQQPDVEVVRPDGSIAVCCRDCADSLTSRFDGYSLR